MSATVATASSSHYPPHASQSHTSTPTHGHRTHRRSLSVPSSQRSNQIPRPSTTGNRDSASVASVKDGRDGWVWQPESAYFDANTQKISNLIDEDLKREAQARKEANRKTIKVMLLGQAESGKSTLQKQFQLYYASQSLNHERPSWIPIVHFNIVKAIRMILDELDYDLSRHDLTTGDTEEPLENRAEAQSDIALLRTRLLSLISMEDSLASELNGGVAISTGTESKTRLFVRAGWQAFVTTNQSRPSTAPRNMRFQPGVTGTLAARTLGTMQEEVASLWNHRATRRILKLRKLRLDEGAPFFLDNLSRIASAEYLPSTDDILNVRLQTIGVIEHTFPNIPMRGQMYEWKLYDVGGARGQRPTWIPYFDDATAIIFLAPISAYDQYLEEDPRTNRIDDSLQLFTAICSNELLKKAHLVLLLNKTDLLRKKVEEDLIPIRTYISSYGTRPNTFKDAAEYFRAHFAQVHRRKDTAKRPLFMHFTSMLDIKATQKIIVNVGEAIIRQHIAQSGLMG